MADGIKEVPEDNSGQMQQSLTDESGFEDTTQQNESNFDTALSGPPAADPTGTDSSEAGSETSSTDEDTPAAGHPLDIEGEIAADYLEELLDVADMDGDIDTYVDNERAQVSVITGSSQLIGSDGEVLEALQELTRLAVTRQTGQRSRLMLDIGGHREDRRRKLAELATDVIHEVKTSGESVRLDPMSPYERKIVHDAVAEAGLSSESDGTEPERRVVVRPSG